MLLQTLSSHSPQTQAIPTAPSWVELPQAYVIMLTTGLEDGGKRATLAFSTACAALAIDKATHIFLVGDGSHWAYEGHTDQIQQNGFPPLGELVDAYLELGGQLYVCSACDQVCSLPTGNGFKRRANVELRGLVSILDYAATSTVLTF